MLYIISMKSNQLERLNQSLGMCICQTGHEFALWMPKRQIVMKKKQRQVIRNTLSPGLLPASWWIAPFHFRCSAVIWVLDVPKRMVASNFGAAPLGLSGQIPTDEARTTLMPTLTQTPMLTLIIIVFSTVATTITTNSILVDQ